MGCGASAEIYPGSKNKYVVDSPPGSGKSNNEETAESNNDSGSLTIGSPVVIRKDPTDKVIEEDAVRGFEDPEDDDIEELEKAKINTPSPGKKSPGQSPSTTTNKIETAEEWLRNHGEKHMMHSKPGVKTPNKSTIYSPPPGSGSLKMTAWE